MRKLTLHKILVLSCAAMMFLQSCKDDGELTALPSIPNSSFKEEFDTTSAALARGWKFINTSDSIGGGIWQQGGEVVPWFRAYSNFGTNAGFIGVDYTSTRAQSVTISNWLISPSVMMQNGDKIIFFTRALQINNGAGDFTDYGNNLQVLINPVNDNLNVGAGLDKGNYMNLYEINPSLVYSSAVNPVALAYPTQWTRFEVPVSGLTAPTRGRFALRYFVTNGGSNGNASGVAIDQVTYTSISK